MDVHRRPQIPIRPSLTEVAGKLASTAPKQYRPANARDNGAKVVLGGAMAFRTALWIGLMLAAGQAWSEAQAAQANWWSAPGREDGPPRIVWAAQKVPETPYTAPNKPVWHIADILKAHRGQQSWDQPVLLTPDFDGHYISLAPGEKTKCHVLCRRPGFGWVYSGQVKVTIDGQEPKLLTKGWAFNVAPRLSYCLENRRQRAGGIFPRHARRARRRPIRKAKRRRRSRAITMSRPGSPRPAAMTALNVPFFDVDAYGASDRTGERFLYDGHTNANLHLDPNITELPPTTDLGHFHANMAEAWVDVYGQLDVLISGVGLVHGSRGDVIHANEERWHRATCRPTPARASAWRSPRTPRKARFCYFQAGD